MCVFMNMFCKQTLFETTVYAPFELKCELTSYKKHYYECNSQNYKFLACGHTLTITIVQISLLLKFNVDLHCRKFRH